MMKKTYDKKSNFKLDQASNKYKNKIIFTLITITGIDIILLLFVNSQQLIIVILLIFAFFITFYSVTLSIVGFGFCKRVDYYKKITSVLPNGKVYKVIKSFIKEIVIYEFKLNKSKRKMKLDYDIIIRENPPITILFNYKGPFDLYAGKYTDNDFFETDNKKLLKFEKYLNVLKDGDRINLDSQNQLMKGGTYDQANVPNLIKIMIRILIVANEEGQPILMSFMHDYNSEISSIPKYTVCLNCEKILGEWTTKYNLEITMCPECFHKTYKLITNGLLSWGSNIEEKMKKIKGLINNE